MRSGDPSFCSKFALFGWDLIEGLAHLHEHGIAHLDIKPGNLFYTDDFHLQIIDFDLAVWVGSEDDTLKGILYMALLVGGHPRSEKRICSVP